MSGGKKVLFLDIDGVCNCATTTQRHFRDSARIGIDPKMAGLVRRIAAKTGCDVVLSSAWRSDRADRGLVRRTVVKFIDVTPTGCGIRGQQIREWLNRHPEYDRYAILDDDDDMLPEQRPHLFQTSWNTGLTEDIVQAVIDHLK